MEKSNWYRWIHRIIGYLVGQGIVACGVVFSLKGNIGVSTGASLPKVLNEIIGGKFTVGTGTTVLMALLVLLQIPILGKKFRLINLLQMIPAFLFGYFVDLFGGLLAGLSAPTYPIKLLFVIISCVLQGLGISIYVNTRIIPSPAEGILLAACERIKSLKLGLAKNILDLTLTCLAAICGLLFLHRIVGIREGTVILAFGVGRIVAWLAKPFTYTLVPFYFGKDSKVMREAVAKLDRAAADRTEKKEKKASSK